LVHFRNKQRKYLKNKINELATNSKNNIRDLHREINEYKGGCQPRNNLVKDEYGDLLAYSHNILNRWNIYLNVNNVSNVRQINIHTTEPLVPGPSHLEIEIAIEKLKKIEISRQ
jgi:hypothetical protein